LTATLMSLLAQIVPLDVQIKTTTKTYGKSTKKKAPGHKHSSGTKEISYKEFEAAMEEVMNDPSRVYKVQLQELYNLGVFLAKKKYRFLRLAYLTFIIGVFASAILGFYSGVLG